MSKLKDKLLKNSTLKYTAILSDSEILNNVKETPTLSYAINIALSGKLNGGIKRGVLQIAAPSRHFKCLGGKTRLVVYEE